MKRLNLLTCFIFSLLIVSPIFAAQNSTYKEIINSVHPYMLYYELNQSNQNTFNAGDIVPVSLYLKNIGDAPIPELYFVIDLSEGCPETNADCYNLFYEEKLTISLDKRENKTINAKIKLPDNLRLGNYTLSFYIRSPRLDIFGTHPIYHPFEQYNFFVEGTGNFPKVKILPDKTTFGMAADQRGPAVNRNAVVEGYFSAWNLLNKQFNGKVKLYSCPFNDIGYFSCEYLKEYKILIPPKSWKGFVYKVATNQEPDVYSLRFELVDEHGKINSIWKSRYIVSGEDAPILGLTQNKFYYKSGENVSISVYVAGPFYPSLVKETEARVKVSINQNNEEIFLDTKTGNFHQNFGKKLNFEFTTPTDLTDYKICARTFSGSGEKLDEICHLISAEKE
ncbi:MAG: hypothetical protein KAU95_03660, partial [Candidatus Aenigmarchaeota archaeon]|nr:hypothetical protein [Candidatus Aenigmarchaeota archaeon]